MNHTISDEIYTQIFSALPAAEKRDEINPIAKFSQQPIHTVYGGAQLFKADAIQKLGNIARRVFDQYLSAPEQLTEIFEVDALIATEIYQLVRKKLDGEPVEDYRIDFEDGFGYRLDDEEDRYAVAAAIQTAQAVEQKSLPTFFGLRIKSFSPEARRRAVRTLDLFLTGLLKESGGKLPENFVVTLPKVTLIEQVAALDALCTNLEKRLGLNPGRLKVELMIETPQALFNRAGEAVIPKLIEAANGRCRSIHFGAFDFTASCGISAADQDIRHPICDFARQMMLTMTAGTGVHLADGVTTILPIEKYRQNVNLTSEQIAENNRVIHRAWKIHYQNIGHSLRSGFYQSWDLHPAQLPARFIATFAFYRKDLSIAATRLKNFIEKAAQATTVGDVFDDAASGQGLLNFFIRGINCGAISREEVLHLTGLAPEDIHSGSFETIIRKRTRMNAD